MRALVVEYDFESAEVCAELVAHLGHEVRFALTKAEALTLVSEFVPDLVFLDTGFPFAPDYELLTIFKNQPNLEGCRYVATGTLRRADLERQAPDVRFDYYLVKPISLESLRDIFVDSERLGARR